MKTATHNGRLVAISQKTSHGITRVAELYITVPEDGHPRIAYGQPELVDSRELHYNGPQPAALKPELSANDRNRLSAARGLPRILLTGAKPDRSGRLPSVTIYNLAIKLGMVIGVPITPLS